MALNTVGDAVLDVELGDSTDASEGVNPDCDMEEDGLQSCFDAVVPRTNFGSAGTPTTRVGE